MSRGLGQTQRLTLAALVEIGEGQLDAVTRKVFITKRPTESQVESTRRALRTLVDRGFVEKCEAGYRLRVTDGGHRG